MMPERYHRLARRTAAIAAALLGLAVFGALLLWLAGTERVLQWTIAQIERASDGRLAVRGAQGSLYGPLVVAEIDYRGAGTVVELRQLRFDWSPLGLLQQHAAVGRLALRELRVIDRGNGGGDTPVVSLRVPMRIVFDAGIERMAVVRGGGEYAFDDVAVHLEKPHAARDELDVEATAHAAGGHLQMHARVAPGAPMPLLAAHATAENIDPARWRSDLPPARIDATLTLSAGPADDTFDARLAVDNALPGPWDAGRWPLRHLALRLAGGRAHIALSDIDVDLGAAGRFAGTGAVRQGQLQLALSTDAFDPHGVLSRLRVMKLAGDVRVQAGVDQQQLIVQMHDRHWRLALDARRRGQSVTLARALLQAGTGTLTLHGTLNLADAQSFQLTGALQEFNPAQFGDFPDARINASLTSHGRLAAEAQATLNFALADSRYRRQVLGGKGTLSISARRIWNSEISLRAGDNRLMIRGAFGRPGDRLAFDLDAGQLALLDARAGGRIRASGTVAGSVAAPVGSVALRADALAWARAYRLATLRADARLAPGATGVLALDADITGLATPQLLLDRASVRAHGVRADHTLQVSARGTDVALDARLDGAWHDATGWSGQIMQLTNAGRHPLALDAPVRLELGSRRLRLGAARFAFAGARVTLDSLRYEAGRIASEGAFTALPLAALPTLTNLAAGSETDLVLGGRWQFVADARLSGQLALYRERGDVRVPGLRTTALGLERLSLTVTATDNRLRAEFDASGTRVGRLRASGQSTLTRRNGRWGIAGSAPLRGELDFAVESLAWLAPLLDPSGAVVFDGAAWARVVADGTVAAPRFEGRIGGEQLLIALPDQGLRLDDGQFAAHWHDRTLRLTTLRLRGGAGTLSGQGELTLGDDAPTLQMTLAADRLEVLSRPDRQLSLSGSGQAQLAAGQLHVSARLAADRGLIALPENVAPRASDDVVVLGRTATGETGSAPFRLGFALDLDLGQRFFVRGRGLDAQLGGAVRLTGSRDGVPTATGSIRVVKGAYKAYGQRLEIERGIVNFQGPVDNPGLNVVALRKGLEVEAGVAIGGTAQAPEVRLVSEPPLPDSEKLAWLVLGHGLADSSGQDFDALQAAAGALLSAGRSVTLQQRIAHMTGLDEVSLKGNSSLEGSVLELGKRLSSRARISYEQSLVGAGTLVKINYMLGKRLSVQAQAGSVAALDLFYTVTFD